MKYFKTKLGEDYLFLKPQSSPRACVYSLLSEKKAGGLERWTRQFTGLGGWTRGERAEEATVPRQHPPPFGCPGS